MLFIWTFKTVFCASEGQQVCIHFLVVKCLKCNIISSGHSYWIAVYLMLCSTSIHTCTHTNQLSCALFSAYQRKNSSCFIQKHSTRGCTCAYRHLLRANKDYSLFLLSKTLHIANPPFTNHRTSALLNLVMLSQLTSHANWPRTVSTGKVSCQRDNDKDAKRSASVFTGWEKEINQILWKSRG